jgi:phosphoribosyl-ATP pyrophosphohydrolase
MGYHKVHIEKGQLGQFSKIREEFEELQDAVLQDNPVLIICELTDLIGSIEAYAHKYNLELKDLIQFSDCTKEAFKEGKRV